MKKVDHLREGILRRKREKSRIKRRFKYFNSSRKHYPPNHPAWRLVERRIKTCFTKVTRILSKYLLGPELAPNYLKAPKVLSFNDNYRETFEFLEDIFSSIHRPDHKEKKLTISFEKCVKLEIGPLLVMQVIIKDFLVFRQKYENKIGPSKYISDIKFEESDDYEVSKLLFSIGYIKSLKKRPKSELLSVSSVGFIVGNKNRKHYSQNQKGPVCRKVRNYLNDCLEGVGFMLNEIGNSHLDGLLSEILNNAEDHSLTDEWYVAGVAYNEKDTEEEQIIGEVNLVIMNLGYSIYEGFEYTRDENYTIYSQMENVYDQAIKGGKYIFRNQFTRENLFTLYALQEGISRIKFEDSSRGNGTMNFINAFMNLGDYEDIDKGYKPKLSILSGKTIIVCNNTYKPQLVKTNDGKSQKYILSLNPENDLKRLPDADHLKKVQKHFPGTLLEIKFYLDKDHLMKKWNDGNGATN